MTWDIYIILDSVINGVNYCCHPACYRTVRSLKAAALAWWGRVTVLQMKRSQVQPQQQFMCASLQKSYQRGVTHVQQRKYTLLITRLHCSACYDSLPVKGIYAKTVSHTWLVRRLPVQFFAPPPSILEPPVQLWAITAILTWSKVDLLEK